MPRRAGPETGGCSRDGVSGRAVSAHVTGTAGGSRSNDSFIRPGQASWRRRSGDRAEFRCGGEGDQRDESSGCRKVTDLGQHAPLNSQVSVNEHPRRRRPSHSATDDRCYGGPRRDECPGRLIQPPRVQPRPGRAMLPATISCQNPRAHTRPLTSESTTPGSASVEVSPKSWTSPSAILRKMRRMILPDRVFGSPSVNWIFAGVAGAASDRWVFC